MSAGWTNEEPKPRATTPAAARTSNVSLRFRVALVIAIVGTVASAAWFGVMDYRGYGNEVCQQGPHGPVGYCIDSDRWIDGRLPHALVAAFVGMLVGALVIGGLAFVVTYTLSDILASRTVDDADEAKAPRRPPRGDEGAAPIGDTLALCGVGLALVLVVVVASARLWGIAGVVGLVLTFVLWVGLRDELLRGAPAPHSPSLRRRIVVAVLAFACLSVSAYLVVESAWLNVAWTDPERLGSAATAFTFAAIALRMLGILLAWQGEHAQRRMPARAKDEAVSEVHGAIVTAAIVILLFAAALAFIAWCPTCDETAAPPTPGAHWATCDLANSQSMPTCDLNESEHLVTHNGAPFCIHKIVTTRSASGVHDAEALVCEAIQTAQEAP